MATPLVESEPRIGKPLVDLPDFRELIIPFGDSGYVVLYHFDVASEWLYILAFRH
jgi:hypothetical protein